jgi:hypothetical protein
LEELVRALKRKKAIGEAGSLLPQYQSPRKRRRIHRGDSDHEIPQESHLDLIKKMISGINALESRVKHVRQLKEQADGAAEFRRVLKREHYLERRWLEYVGSSATSATAKVSENTGERDHFSTAIPEGLRVHDRLEPGQIRLLILLPAKKEYYPLLCTLETRTWQGDTEPRYAALSYFWGSDICNGRLYLARDRHAQDLANPDHWGHTEKNAIRIPIRNNLFRALLRLRRSDRPVSLWVDAMCINQDDTEEKTDQLGQMVNVYSKAENVCVWLGESDDEGRSNIAMKFIREIMDFAVLDRYARDKRQAMKWHALAELMRDRWFSRRWVVQEISLALGKVSIHCGGEMVHGSDFADAVSLLASNQEAVKNLFDYSEWREGPNTLGNVESFGAYVLLEATSKLFLTTTPNEKKEVEITKPIKCLESLVTSLKTFDASDPRDLIYSLVSIASDTSQGSDIYPGKRTEGLSGKENVSLKVDYSKSKVDVYKDFVRFCILSSGSLDVICRPWAMPIAKKASDKKSLETLPSWIPLLAQSEFGEPEDIYSGRKNGENLVGPVGHPHYKASGDILCDGEWSTEDSNRTSQPPRSALNMDASADETITRYRAVHDPIVEGDLQVKGFELARIQKVSARNTGGVILRESLEMGSWSGISANVTRVPDKIWRTLVADRDPDGQSPPSWYQRACLRCLEIADTYNNGDLNMGELLQGPSGMLRKYLTRMRNVTWNRRFFTATTTRPADQSLFGLGPPGTDVGDFVCIFFGCSVPVIVREFEGGMKLIGEAYVYGKMEGEAIADLKAGNTFGRETEFELK